MAKSKKKAEGTKIEVLEDELLSTLSAIIIEARRNREQFDSAWSEIIDQVNLTPPEAWEDKADWQTKIYVPESAKIDETANSMLTEIVFPPGRWYDFIGVDSLDREEVESLGRFFDVCLDLGGWKLHNGFTTAEATRLGTSFLKILVDPRPYSEDWKGFTFDFVSIRDCGFDPKAIIDFKDAKYWIQERKVNISDILASPLYTQEKKDDLLQFLSGETERSDTREKVVNIYYGEGNKQYQITNEYQVPTIIELWGFFPVPKEKTTNGVSTHYIDVEWRVITVANDKVIIRNDDNAYGFIPAVRARVKRRQDHGYGYGFIWAIRGLQDLMNSMVNHGFDSAKISMPIAKFETDAVADPSSIQIKPLAVWRLNSGGIDKARIENIPTNSTTAIVNDVALIDQFIQESSGVSKHSQGVNPIYGQEETLGQTRIKQESVQKRFLKIAREYTEDYVIPTLRMMHKMMVHPQFIDKFQQLANRTIGFDDLPQQIETGVGPQEIPVKTPKVDLQDIRRMGLDFKPVGMINFIEKAEKMQQLDAILTKVAENPQLQQVAKIDKVFERMLQMGNIPDYHELIKSEDEQAEDQEALMEQMLADTIGGQGGQTQTQ